MRHLAAEALYLTPWFAMLGVFAVYMPGALLVMTLTMLVLLVVSAWVR